MNARFLLFLSAILLCLNGNADAQRGPRLSEKPRERIPGQVHDSHGREPVTPSDLVSEKISTAIEQDLLKDKIYPKVINEPERVESANRPQIKALIADLDLFGRHPDHVLVMLALSEMAKPFGLTLESQESAKDALLTLASMPSANRIRAIRQMHARVQRVVDQEESETLGTNRGAGIYAYFLKNPDLRWRVAQLTKLSAFCDKVEATLSMALVNELNRATSELQKPPSVNLADKIAHTSRRPIAAAAAIGPGGAKSRVTLTINHAGHQEVREINIPAWELFNVERKVVRDRFFKAVSSVPPELPVMFTEMPSGMSTSDVLPGRVTVRTFDSSLHLAQDHLQNFDRLVETTLDPSRTRFFNFVGPPDSHVARTQSPARIKQRWNKLGRLYDGVANDLGLNHGGGRDDLLDTLSSGESDVVIVVAHGDQETIYLPNGEIISIDDVRALPKLSLTRPPIVVLLACETGRTTGSGVSSVAQALLESGRATAVLAPVRVVPAGVATTKTLRDLFAAGVKTELPSFLRGLRGPWQFYVYDDIRRPSTEHVEGELSQLLRPRSDAIDAEIGVGKSV